MRRVALFWALLALALEAFLFAAFQLRHHWHLDIVPDHFHLPSNVPWIPLGSTRGYYAFLAGEDNIDVVAESHVGNVVEGEGEFGGEGEASNFPDDMSYWSFLEAHHPERIKMYSAKNRSLSEEWAPYFPDFCADCAWGGGQTCSMRAHFLHTNYGTQNAEETATKENPVCKNPPLRIYWEDDATTHFGATEGGGSNDNMFARPRPKRGSKSVPHPSASPMLGKISIYVYDTLRPDVGVELERTMRRRYSQPNHTLTNIHADMAIVDLFRTFPGRTNDPQKADLFVVPYAHASHCASKPGWLRECGHISQQDVQGGVFDRLDHYAGNEGRHLFLNVINQGNAHERMRELPLSLTIGPKYRKTQILVPYLNHLAAYQPSAIRSRSEEWWARPRTYAMAFFFGVVNFNLGGAEDGARIYRQHFLDEVATNWSETLGGLPYAIRAVSKPNLPPSSFLTRMYSDSIFCPAFPGDSPQQKRFFDAILMGCIPVVLSFDVEVDGKATKSWHLPNGRSRSGRSVEGAPVEDSYPWAKGSNSTHSSNEIDYRSFVVEVTGGVQNVRPTLEALMQNYSEIRRRQLNLRKYAPYFTYGMSKDSHKYPDAFSKILESLQFYLGLPKN